MCIVINESSRRMKDGDSIVQVCHNSYVPVIVYGSKSDMIPSLSKSVDERFQSINFGLTGNTVYHYIQTGDCN